MRHIGIFLTILSNDLLVSTGSLRKVRNRRDAGLATRDDKRNVRDSSQIVNEGLSLESAKLFEGDIVQDDFVDIVYGLNKQRNSDARTSKTTDDSTWLANDMLSRQQSRNVLYSECPTSDGASRSAPKRSVAKRAATIGTDRLWTDAVVHYEFDPSVSPEKLHVIKSAMSHWETHTCVRFQPRTTEPDYLSFYNGAGCFTTVGRAGGRQGVSINDSCMFKGTVVHEIAHALGFWHEQSRPDRDESVTILWENIEQGKAHNFNKMDYTQIDSRGVKYDYNSIMHYGPYSFSANDSRPTIVAKHKSPFHDRITMGQRSRLSRLDIQQAEYMYCCPKGGCASNPCSRGRCRESIAPPFYHCTCFTGWYGPNCTVNDDKCALQPCGNGRCRSDESLFAGFECICNTGYEGLLCDKEVNECEEKPCKNGGTCIDQLAGYKCECVAGYRGENCQFLECPTDMFGCANRSVCVSRQNVCDFNNDCGDWSDEACGDCSFETGLCGWSSSSIWKWNVTAGATLSEGTGPELDHTLHNAAGKYAYAEASSAPAPGARAILVSPLYPASSQSCRLEFAYHMFGPNVKSFIVELVTEQPLLGTVIELFRINGNQGNEWHLGKIDLGKQFLFRIRFVAVKGVGWQGDIAIDDVMFLGCSLFSNVNDCEHNECQQGQCLDGVGDYSCQCFPGFTGELCQIELDECAGQPCGQNGTCTDLVNDYRCYCDPGYTGRNCEVKANYVCDLQEGLCDPWRHSPDGDFQWTRWAGQTPSKGTGPDTDHTTRSVRGYYMFIEGSDPQTQGDRAIIEMGPLSRSEKNCMLTFSYHMFGETMGKIEVAVKLQNGTSVTIWSVEGDQGNKWLIASVSLGLYQHFTVQIIGVVGSFWESDAAIDDIMLSGSCGVVDPCDALPCGAHGRCVLDDTMEPQCQCREGYQGVRCDTKVGFCATNPCNNGTCVETRTGYLCSCSVGYHGSHCRKRDYCAGKPCAHGRCSNLISGFLCQCYPGYTGLHCNISSCHPNSCSDRGICVPDAASYTCQCSQGYSGTNCEIKSPPLELDLTDTINTVENDSNSCDNVSNNCSCLKGNSINSTDCSKKTCNGCQQDSLMSSVYEKSFHWIYISISILMMRFYSS